MSWQAFDSAKQQVLSFNAQAVARTQELGSQLAFDLVSRRLADLQRILQEIDVGVGSLVPDQIWVELRDVLNQATNYVALVQSFQINQENAYAQKSNIEAQFEGIYNAAVKLLAIPLSISSSLGSGSSLTAELASIRREAENTITSATNAAAESMAVTKEELETAKEAAAKDAANLSQLLEEVRKEAAEIISTRAAENFQHSSDEYAKSAKRWLQATVITGTCLLALACISLWLATSGIYRGLDAASASQVALAKIALFVIFGYFTTSSAKNFYANRHNEAVNKHRSNAISSYRSLMEATTTPEHKDIILTQASSAVFSPQETGFSKQNGAQPEMPTTIINSLTKPLGG